MNRTRMARLARTGSWFDSEASTLVVAVTDASRVQQVQAAGATARVVRNSAAQRGALKATLDQRQASAPSSVTGWAVDTMTNSVVRQRRDHLPPAGQRGAEPLRHDPRHRLISITPVS